MLRSILALSSSLLLFLAACSPSTESNQDQSFDATAATVAKADADALVICVGSDDGLIDFVQVLPDSTIERIEFEAPADGTEIFVFAVGENIEQRYNMNLMVAASKRADVFIGKVSAHVADGVVTGFEGNTLGMEPRIEKRYAEAIQQARVAQANHDNLQSTLVVKKDRFRATLITDTDGNQHPESLSASEEQFLDTIVEAMTSGDYSKFSEITYSKSTDSYNLSAIGNGLQSFEPFKYQHYIFCPIDPEHPDNRDTFVNSDGEVYKYHVAPTHSVTLMIQSDLYEFPMSYSFTAGELDGEIRITFPH